MSEDRAHEHDFDPMARTSSSGIKHMPVGTLEEIQAEGLNPDLIASCHSRVEGVTRGCPVWSTCQFHLKERGGFKGKGPKNVGYYLRTTRDEGARTKEDFIPCYGFVLALQSRMNFGRAQKEEGKEHEVIRIVAQEGEKIAVRHYVSVAADGGNRTGDIRIREIPEIIEVPKFLRPRQNPGVTYEQMLRQREGRRLEIESETEDERFENMRRLLREDNEERVLDMEPEPKSGNGAADAAAASKDPELPTPPPARPISVKGKPE